MNSRRLNDEQRARLHDLFGRAIELADRDRAAFCARECAGDAVLHAELDALLGAAPGEDDSFLGQAALSSPAKHDIVMEDSGLDDFEQVGPYRVLERIGEGGFGTVWMAEQREPVKRRVALKIIKLGMDTKQVIARFEAERQALAMMDHPNIAKVFDAGSTDTGRPYFVMEYIRGIPIVDYCDAERLDTKARLGLFVSVCRAIQHAHQKGVIHRDIKPSNVLITMHDGVPVPKVIDFGIAKATNTELTQKTLFTEHGQMIGTPAYMSPEQAEMGGLGIDTRADVYSLGVLLYELLTGTTPFDVTTLMRAGYAELVSIIRDEEPPKPSTRLSSLGDAATHAAEQRRVDSKQLGRSLCGDLDWIVMRCLEKDRTRRYETANGLAADVLRHLAHEPVSAGPPGARYQLQKFVKRHRGRVIAAGAFGFALVLGVIGTTGGLFWALDEKDRADEQTRRVDRERQSAELASELVIDWLGMINLENGPLDKRKLLDRAASKVERAFGSRPRAESRMRMVLGEAYSSIGENALAIEHLARALNLLDDLPEATPLELYEILSTYRWPAGVSADPDLGVQAPMVRERMWDTAVDLFVEDHLELARMMSALRAEWGRARIVERFDAVLGYAEDGAKGLSDGDRRWLALGDFLIQAINRGGFGDTLEEKYHQVAAIYRDKVRLPESNTRVLIAHFIFLEQLQLSGRLAQTVALSEDFNARLESVLPAGHWLRGLHQVNHGSSLVALGEFDRGLGMVEAGARVWRGASEGTYASVQTAVMLVKACDAAVAAGRAPADRARDARAEAVAACVGAFAGWINLEHVEVILGPDHSDLTEPMRACWQRRHELEGLPPELSALSEQCRERFGIDDDRAVVVAGGLLHFGDYFGNRQTADLLPLLEYCVAACGRAKQALLPQAMWRQALTEISIGDVERGIAHAQEGLDRFGGHVRWKGSFHSILGLGKDRLGREDAEEHFRTAYEAVARSAGIGDVNTARVHRWLQDHYLRRGRVQQSVKIAQERLEGLLRRSAGPRALHETAWMIVRSTAGEGESAALALKAARKCCALAPDVYSYRLGLGAALLRSGATESALDELGEAGRSRARQGLELPTSLPALQAIALMRLGRRSDAEAALERAQAQLARAGADNTELQRLVAEARTSVYGPP